MNLNEFVKAWRPDLVKSGQTKEIYADFRTVIEGMASDEEMINAAVTYVNHKSLKPANRGLIKDALIIGMKWFRTRILEAIDNNEKPIK